MRFVVGALIFILTADFKMRPVPLTICSHALYLGGGFISECLADFRKSVALQQIFWIGPIFISMNRSFTGCQNPGKISAPKPSGWQILPCKAALRLTWCNCWVKEGCSLWIWIVSFILSWKLVEAWSKTWKQSAEHKAWQCSEFCRYCYFLLARQFFRSLLLNFRTLVNLH